MVLVKYERDNLTDPEFRIGNFPIFIFVHCGDHLIYFLVSNFSWQVHQYKSKLLSKKKPVRVDFVYVYFISSAVIQPSMSLLKTRKHS